MNSSKIVNCAALLTKFQPSTLVIPAINKARKVPSNIQFAFFSHFCNPFKLAEVNKLTLSPLGITDFSSRGLKTRGHLQLRCKDCYMARKDGELYVFCKSHPRHNQRKLSKRTKYSWILTYAFQSKQRPY